MRLMRNAYRHPFLIALNFLATLAAAVGLALIFHNTGTDTGGIQNRCGMLPVARTVMSLRPISQRLPVFLNVFLTLITCIAALMPCRPAVFWS